MPSRWDFLYDVKPVPIADHLVEEIAKLVAKDLESWPLTVQAWASEADAQRFRRILEPGAPRPDAKIYEAAFMLARLELEREYERIDEFMRNEGWRAYTPPGDGYDAMVLLSRYLLEQMLAVAEMTNGRLKRPVLVTCLEKAERRLRSGQAGGLSSLRN